MYSIRKNYLKFNSEVNFSLSLLKIKNEQNQEVFIDQAIEDKKQVYMQSAAVTNQIWQSWNSYWRNYWLTHFYGGMGLNSLIPFNNLNINGASSKMNEEEAIYLILKEANWNFNRYIVASKRVKHFQEPTWGDTKTITKIASAFISNQVGVQLAGDRVMAALSVLKDSPEDLQLVRNCSIHLSKASMLEVKANLTPKYSISTFKYPTEILYSNRISTQPQMALIYWTDELVTFLNLLEP